MIGHFQAGQAFENQQLATHGQQSIEILAYLLNFGFWFESFQNWQSEFLSTAVLIVMSIYLREKGSARRMNRPGSSAKAL